MSAGARTVAASLVAGPIVGFGAYWFAHKYFYFGDALGESYAVFAVPGILGLMLLANTTFLGPGEQRADRRRAGMVEPVRGVARDCGERCGWRPACWCSTWPTSWRWPCRPPPRRCNSNTTHRRRCSASSSRWSARWRASPRAQAASRASPPGCASSCSASRSRSPSWCCWPPWRGSTRGRCEGSRRPARVRTASSLDDVLAFAAFLLFLGLLVSRFVPVKPILAPRHVPAAPRADVSRRLACGSAAERLHGLRSD